MLPPHWFLSITILDVLRSHLFWMDLLFFSLYLIWIWLWVVKGHIWPQCVKTWASFCLTLHILYYLVNVHGTLESTKVLVSYDLQFDMQEKEEGRGKELWQNIGQVDFEEGVDGLILYLPNNTLRLFLWHGLLKQSVSKHYIKMHSWTMLSNL